MKIIAEPNKDRSAFHIPSEHSRAQLLDWFRKYDRFEITPVVDEHVPTRRYLEGAVIPAYAHWQYGIDPTEPGRDEARRFLFKRDFHYEIVKDQQGNPHRVPKSSRGEARAILEHYTRYAQENGAPIPNAALYKLYRGQWAGDPRFDSLHAFLDFLGLECDAMPSDQALAKLGEVPDVRKDLNYPELINKPTL